MKVNKLLSSLIFPILLTGTISAQNTTTVTFKPGPAVGEDALVWWTANNCTLTYFLPARNGPAQTQNFGDLPDLMIDHWSFNAIGCNEGKRNVLIRFTELSSLPPNVTITNATLKLYNPPASNGGEPNSVYPGSPYINNNSGTLSRILPGVNNNWEELTVTWNSANNLTLAPNTEWVNIPNSTREYNEILSLNVTNAVQKIVDDINNQTPYANNGFLLKLNQAEDIYRKWYFASSDNPTSLYRPELVIEYVEEIQCDANFTTAFSTINPLNYTFSAIEPNAFRYEWSINGNIVGNNKDLNHSFTKKEEAAEVCLKVYMSEEVSCTICTKIFGETSVEDLNAKILLQVTPNPTSSVWVISAKNLTNYYNKYVIRDINGRIIEKNIIDKENIEIGDQINSGLHLLELIGDNYIYHTKILKH